MGWRELRGWLRALQRDRERESGRPDPDRWTPASRQNFAALHAERDRIRGR